MDRTKNLVAGFVAVVLAAIFGILLLTFESEAEVGGLVAGAALVVALAGWRGWLGRIGRAFETDERIMATAVVVAVLAMTAWFAEDHFPLLMMATVLLTIITCLGLTTQFGYTGMVNFAGASFYGVGAYTAAVLVHYTALPHILAIPAGGVMAAVVGTVLVWPMLRTKGHYSAVVTIAFAILFKTFLEVNDTLGGPQGMKIRNISILGWKPNADIELFSLDVSHFLVYVVGALLLAILVFTVMRRIERSWIGLSMDTVRIDETAAACFGLDVARWKVVAFTTGNVMAGMAGALYAMMIGYIGPNNFTFADSLLLVSIVLLGGIGNVWGVVVASVFVVVLPEKFQVLQEYRFLLYAVLVMLVLLFRPQGLLPRRPRIMVPGGRS